MTPETRLAWWSVGLIATGLLMIAAAMVAAGREHRREGP